MRLVDNDIPQPAEKLLPGVVVGQDAYVHHIGVREHDLRRPLDSGAFMLRGIAVEGVIAQLNLLCSAQLPETAQLVLGQRLGRKEIQGAARLLGEDGVEHGYVIAEGLAAGGGGDHHHVFTCADKVDRPGLVAVKREQVICLE